MDSLAQQIATGLENSVRQNVEGKTVAVQFSGGLDSGLVGALSKKYASETIFYVVGTEDSHDVYAAKSAAKLIGNKIEIITVNEEIAVDLIAAQEKITKCQNPLMLSFTAPLFGVIRESKEDIILTGQGADELFGGYSKYLHVKNDELKTAMKKDLERLYTESIPHENILAEKYEKKIIRPYLQKSIEILMENATPDEIRPTPDSRKKVLCDVQQISGFEFLAERPKKAAQYGSGILDSVKNICHKNGIEYNELISRISDDKKYGDSEWQFRKNGSIGYTDSRNPE